MKTLRPYQAEAVQSTFDYLANNSGNPLIVAPVAAGKSLLMAETARLAIQAYPKTRVLVLAHVKELLQQNWQELMGQDNSIETGFFCAGLGKKQMIGSVIFGSIQSMAGKVYDHKPFDLVLVDECHLISEKQDGQYQSVITDLKTVNPHVRIIGYTGTPYRPDTGLLINGSVFDDISYDIPVQLLIDEGFLCPPVTPKVETKMDTTGVQTRFGDYVESQLAKAIDKEPITRACVEEVIAHGKDRKKWLVFGANIEHAEHIQQVFEIYDIPTAFISGKTPKKERAEILEAYGRGDYRCLVNVAVLTTGYNEPAIDLIAFMRPTRSPVLYVQMVGRGMRLHPGKKDCMLLDFGGVVDELGPIDQINIVKKNSGTGNEAPVKQCPKCYAFLHAAKMTCEECGHEFEVLGPDIFEKAEKNKAVLASQLIPQEVEVLDMFCVEHKKEGKPPSMKVVYATMGQTYYEWICFEHSGFAREKAAKWHKYRSMKPLPNTVEEALKIDYPKPKKITVRQGQNKFWEIIDYDYTLHEEDTTKTQEEEYEIPF